jgi:hypothetical protein
MAFLASPYSTTATVTFATAAWLLSDPIDGTIVYGAILTTPKQTRPLPGGPLKVLGRANDVVVTDVLGGVRLDLTFQCLTLADQTALEALLARGRTLTLRSTIYPSLLVRLNGDLSTDITASGVNVIWRTQVPLSQVTV